MHRGLLLAVMVGCQEPALDWPDAHPGGADEPAEPSAADRPVPTQPGNGTVPSGVNATGLAATPYAKNPLGRSLSVTLSEAAPAVVTCTLEAAPPLSRQLLPLDADWRWLGDADPGEGFVNPAFDDSAWPVGPAPFAESDPAATELSPGDADAPERTFFRTTFEVADPAAMRSLAAHVRRDDGVVLWLNGVEVARDNVPVLLPMNGEDEETLLTFELDTALLVAGTNTLAAELTQEGGGGDGGFAVRLVADVEEHLPEVHVLRSAAAATTHTISWFGLLADATYTCEARADGSDGAPFALTVQTEPLPVSVALAAPPGMDALPGYTLFNHSRPCGGDRSNRLFVVDPEGRVRWTQEIPIDAPGSIDIESVLLPDGNILWGGSEEPGGEPQIVGLDGEMIYRSSYPGVEYDIYHHDVEQTPDGHLLGMVSSVAVDGADSWTGFAFVEHDPATGEVTWRWESQQAYDFGELTRGPRDEPDPWHPNSFASVDDADGPAIYVSFFDRQEIVRVDRATGHVTWHLGLGKDFTLTNGEWFETLHSVQIAPGPNGPLVYLMDNGLARETSRAMALELDSAAREATIVWEWTEPNWFEPHWGDAEPIGDGTSLVTMSHAWCNGGSLDHLGAFVRVEEATGDVVARLDFLDADDSTYRGQHLDGCALFANARYCPQLSEE